MNLVKPHIKTPKQLFEKKSFFNDCSIKVDIYIYSSPDRNVTNMKIRGQRGQMGCCTFGKGAF